jgi:hypothetical protein
MNSKFNGVISSRYCLYIPVDKHISLNTLNIFYRNMDEQVNHNTCTGNSKSHNFTNDKLIVWNNTRCLKVEVRLVITCLTNCRVAYIDKVLETECAILLMLAFPFQFFFKSLSGSSADVSSAICEIILFDEWVHSPLITPGE